MKKALGPIPAVFPMPVLMVAAYDENEKVNVMNAAWGMISDMNQITLDKDHMDVADFFGIATGNTMKDKFERTGYTAVKSAFVNAPVIEEFPVVMECELEQVIENDTFYAIVGKIINTSAEESVLDENGKIEPTKVNALVFDQFQLGYYTIGEKVGQAWDAGKEWMKK